MKNFFQVFVWVPSKYGVGSYKSPTMFFELEESILSLVVLSWVLSATLVLISVILEVAQMFGLEINVGLSFLNNFIIFFGFCVISLSLQQIVKLLFSRKINDEHLFAMLKWHKMLPDLPRPHRDMTKRDLALYVDAAYKEESERCKKNSIMDI